MNKYYYCIKNIQNKQGLKIKIQIDRLYNIKEPIQVYIGLNSCKHVYIKAFIDFIKSRNLFYRFRSIHFSLGKKVIHKSNRLFIEKLKYKTTYIVGTWT